MSQESLSLGSAHLVRMALAMEQNEPLGPLHILRFHSDAVMFDPDYVADLIEQLWGELLRAV